jgi:radical SAM superfamily enzyme YgiQ (UPF0313 family)
MLYPPGAPALLKAVLQKNGYRCFTKDFVAGWFNSFKDHPEWATIDSWNALGHLKIPHKLEKLIETTVRQWAREIIKKKAEWIGLSIFSYESHRIGSLLSKKIKELNPKQKIFMGGLGITNVSEKYAETLLEQGIIDAFITGEGENSILELAKGNLQYPGINNKKYKQLSKEIIDSQPTPDFSDYDLSLYGKENLGVYQDTNSYKSFNMDQNTLPITASRGCVRQCGYCDVPLLWPKFTHRGGEVVANEIISHHKRSGTRRFHFTDSLVNGSMKDFRIMIDKLARYNIDNGANITWSGQMIFRPNRQHTQEDWRIMAESGASVFEVGIESGSDEIRFQMGKKFTNEDTEYELQNAYKNKIAIHISSIVGWPTETEKHLEQCKDFLIRFHPFAHNRTILDIEMGGTLRIQPNTPLYMKKDEMGIEMIPTGGAQEDLLWWNKNNPTLTLSKRILHRFELGKLARDLGYNMPTNEKDRLYLWSKWNQLKDIEKEWLNERKT